MTLRSQGWRHGAPAQPVLGLRTAPHTTHGGVTAQRRPVPPGHPARRSRDALDGRSPGSRLTAPRRLPSFPVACWRCARRLQLRGQPRHGATSPHRVPFSSAHAEPSRRVVAQDGWRGQGCVSVVAASRGGAPPPREAKCQRMATGRSAVPATVPRIALVVRKYANSYTRSAARPSRLLNSMTCTPCSTSR